MERGDGGGDGGGQSSLQGHVNLFVVVRVP